jgi:hypothetical protein
MTSYYSRLSILQVVGPICTHLTSCYMVSAIYSKIKFRNMITNVEKWVGSTKNLTSWARFTHCDVYTFALVFMLEHSYCYFTHMLLLFYALFTTTIIVRIISPAAIYSILSQCMFIIAPATILFAILFIIHVIYYIDIAHNLCCGSRHIPLFSPGNRHQRVTFIICADEGRSRWQTRLLGLTIVTFVLMRHTLFKNHGGGCEKN